MLGEREGDTLQVWRWVFTEIYWEFYDLKGPFLRIRGVTGL